MGLVNIGAKLELKGLQRFLRGMDRAGRRSRRSSRAANRAKVSFGGLAGALGATAGAAGGVVGAFGSVMKMTGGITAATVGLGAAVTREYGKFDKAIQRINTLLGPGVDAMKEYGDFVLDTTGKFGSTMETTADATFQAISAGVNPSRESIDTFMQVVGKASVGGFTKMNTAVDGLTNIMNAYALSVNDAETISDNFFVANKLGKTTFDELARSLGTVAPLAQSLNVDYTDLLGATVSLTKAGISTSMAMTQVKAMLSNILKPSAKARKEAKKLGLEFGPTALKAKGFVQTLKDITEAIQKRGTDESIGRLFKSTEAVGALMRLTSQGGMFELTNSIKEMGSSAGTTEEAFAKVSNTIGFKLEQVKAGLGRFMIATGGGLAEGMGLGGVKDIPSAMERAAEGGAVAAEQFGTSFMQAFAPGFNFANLNWAQIGSDLGRGAGQMANAFKSMSEMFVLIMNSDYMQGLLDLARITLGDTRDDKIERQGLQKVYGVRADGTFRDVTPEERQKAILEESGKFGVFERMSIRDRLQHGMEMDPAKLKGWQSDSSRELLTRYQRESAEFDANLARGRQLHASEAQGRALRQRHAEIVPKYAGGMSTGEMTVPVPVTVTLVNNTTVNGATSTTAKELTLRGAGSGDVTGTTTQRVDATGGAGPSVVED